MPTKGKSSKITSPPVRGGTTVEGWKRPPRDIELMPIPKFKTEAAERKFWETHDSSDYLPLSKGVRAHFPNLKSSPPGQKLKHLPTVIKKLPKLGREAEKFKKDISDVKKLAGRYKGPKDLSGKHDEYLTEDPIPGEILLEEFLKPMTISRARLARETGIPRKEIAEIISGKRGINVQEAEALGQFFKTGPEFWINLWEVKLKTVQKKLGPKAKKLGFASEDDVLKSLAKINKKHGKTLRKLAGLDADDYKIAAETLEFIRQRKKKVSPLEQTSSDVYDAVHTAGGSGHGKRVETGNIELKKQLEAKRKKWS